MNNVNKLLWDLSNFSPPEGPAREVMKEAAERIRCLSDIAARLQRDKIILREALVKIVGASNPAELEVMKQQLGIIEAFSNTSPKPDLQVALEGINALLDTQ